MIMIMCRVEIPYITYTRFITPVSTPCKDFGVESRKIWGPHGERRGMVEQSVQQVVCLTRACGAIREFPSLITIGGKSCTCMYVL